MRREEAIKIMKNYPEWHHFHESEEKAFRMGLKALEQEPKMGQWEKTTDGYYYWYKCSECGGEPYYGNTIYNYKFCPYCGAKMVEQQESEEV